MRQSNTPSTLIAVGLGKKPALPPRMSMGFGAQAQPSADGMTDPASPDPMSPTSSASPSSVDSKVPREQAGFIEASRSCGNCTNWDNQTGDCMRVEGTMDCNDRCETYFSPTPRAGQSGQTPQPSPAHSESMELPPTGGAGELA